MTGPTEVVPYDPGRPERFEAERAEPERALGRWLEEGIHRQGELVARVGALDGLQPGRR